MTRKADLFSICLASSLAVSQAFTSVQSGSKISFSNLLPEEAPLCSASSATTEEDFALQEQTHGVATRTRKGETEASYVSTLSSNQPQWLEDCSDCTPDGADQEVRRLEYALLEQGFPIDDVQQIVTDISKASNGDQSSKVGIVNFLKIALSLKGGEDDGSAHFVTTQVLRACVFHYAEPSNLALLPPSTCGSDMVAVASAMSPDVECVPSVPSSCLLAPAMVPTELNHATSSSWIGNSNNQEILGIVEGASRIKRAELLVQAVHRESASKSPEKVRDLLLSVMEDWRSLGIRALACLYCLERLLETSTHGANEFVNRTPEVVQTAREGLRIYAPLAQRLGLQPLKARIESNAFRILYRRQFEAAKSIYREGGEAMHALSTYLRTQIACTLRSDDALMSQLQDLQVVSRVKEPYSFWRKLLRKRLKGSDSKEELGSSSLSVAKVQDGVALRIILKASKLSRDETTEAVRARENLLCYYVQQLIRRQWPEIDASRLKDYIAKPKPNGYQSLHHTSKISNRGLEFPFEVQVRSADMHQLAEFGGAAHWDYKLDGGKKNPLLQQSHSGNVPVIQGSTMATNSLAIPSGQQANPYIDALVGAKELLARQQVYVFVIGCGGNAIEQKELVSVPVDSSVQSAISEIESFPFVSAKVQVWKNGMLANLDDTLENGDVIMIAV